MTAEPMSAAAPPQAQSTRELLRPVVGVLADGTPFYVPIGEILVGDARVTCHLCGRSFRSVTAHLRAHGWSKQRYCMTFGLERHQSLEGHETRKLRSAAFAARLIFETAVREGSAAGRVRARAGELARDAAAAARGRPIPEQRRRKNARASDAGLSAATKTASRERADRKLAAVASSAAARQGFADIGTLAAAGLSLAAVSREIGLHKDWLSRHLVRLDPMAASLARQRPRSQPDGAWMPILHGLGFDDVGVYLRDRHVLRHQTVNAIAAEMECPITPLPRRSGGTA
jgi:hypothetical protein